MHYVAPPKICFMNHNALNHQVRASPTLSQISVAFPTAIQVNFSFNEKLFHPQLCLAGASAFAICYHVTSRGWKQRKYWKMAKMHIERTWEYILLFLAVAPLCLLLCLAVWRNAFLTSYDCSHSEGRAGATCLCCQSRENQHGAELWLLTGWPASPWEITFKRKRIEVFQDVCSYVFYIHMYNIIFRSSSLTAVRPFW